MDKIGPGIDKYKMRVLREETMFEFEESKRLCVVLFDIMPVQISHEAVSGAGMSAQRSENVPSGNVLVFMFQGVSKRKQHVVAHYIIKGTVESMQLSETVKEVVQAVMKTTHTVLGVVCNHSSLNVTAMDLLSQTSNSSVSHSFKLNGRTIFIIYDVPQLFISIRDHFRESGEIDMNGRISKWSHMVELYEKIDTENYSHAEHLNPTEESRKSVSLAAQLLSRTTAGYLNILLKPFNKRNLEYRISSWLIYDLNKLFYSTNGPGHKDEWLKGYNEWVTKHTFHHKEWAEYIEKLKTVRYPNANDELKSRSERCINCYIKTLLSLQGIWDYLNRRSVKSLSLRRLNQDKLQRIFRIIMKKYRTRQPTSEEFTSALKTIDKRITNYQRHKSCVLA